MWVRGLAGQVISPDVGERAGQVISPDMGNISPDVGECCMRGLAQS